MNFLYRNFTQLILIIFITILYFLVFEFITRVGLAITTVMLVLSLLDQSRDEYIIHITASSMPLVCIWIIRNYFVEKCRFFPFLEN